MADSQTEPGRTMGFGAGPIPEGVYYTNLTDYGVRSTSPDTTTGVEVADVIWSTPWHLFGANLAIDFNPINLVETTTSTGKYISGFSGPYFAAILGWDLGHGFGASYTVGGYLPVGTEVSDAFGTFEQRFGLSYSTNGWLFAARALYGLTTTDDKGLRTAPDYLNVDLTAIKTFGKWQAGLVGFASTDLDSPFAGYREQSQFALGGLVGYDFGPVTLRLKLTRTIEEQNYGGYDTRLWTDVLIPLWTPKQALSAKD
jgi:hypothetical protein